MHTGEAFPKYKAAAVQAAPVFLDREATVDKACSLIGEAASQEAALVVFPETWVPGYPVWTNAISRWNYPPAKKVYARLYKNAVEIPSPTVPGCEPIGRALTKKGFGEGKSNGEEEAPKACTRRSLLSATGTHR